MNNRSWKTIFESTLTDIEACCCRATNTHPDNSEISGSHHHERCRVEDIQNGPTVAVKGNVVADYLAWVELYLTSFFDSAPDSVPEVVQVAASDDSTMSENSEISYIGKDERHHQCSSVRPPVVTRTRSPVQNSEAGETSSVTLSQLSMSETVLNWMFDVYPDVFDETSYSLLKIPTGPSFNESPSFQEDANIDLPAKSGTWGSFNKRGFGSFEGNTEGERLNIGRGYLKGTISSYCTKTHCSEQSLEYPVSIEKGRSTGSGANNTFTKSRSVHTKNSSNRKRRSHSKVSTDDDVPSVIYKKGVDPSLRHVPDYIEIRSTVRYGYV